MYEIEFYETKDGKCLIWDFLEALRLKAPTNKDARIVLHAFAQNNDLVRIFRSIFFALVDKLRTKS